MKQATTQILQNFFEENERFAPLRDRVQSCVEEIVAMHKRGNKLLLCGNGGSAADCEHIAGELLKGFCLRRPVSDGFRARLIAADENTGDAIADNLQQGVKAVPLTGFSGYATAFHNDCDGQFVYAQLVNVLGDKGDVLFAISTSGNSASVLYAAQTAKAKGMTVVALTGESGGRLKGVCDILIDAPQKDTYKIQECHLPLYHAICLAVETELFDY
ncbi:MAG: SIS domain-containing protein [Corallococcus sp.]|nr:SIS domain-containing protein [Corallococcus sp.]MCM1359595.1 SIS domain-containing protein [Corallococcus sp.]MCM1395187.1 SIS domain-containing protein [Corallococcus sp.]